MSQGEGTSELTKRYKRPRYHKTWTPQPIDTNSVAHNTKLVIPSLAILQTTTSESLSLPLTPWFKLNLLNGSLLLACYPRLSCMVTLRVSSAFLPNLATSYCHTDRPSFVSASYQVEGAHDTDGRGPSVWDDMCRVPGQIANFDNGDDACNAYHMTDVDVPLLKSLGANTYRFSIAWSRLIPLGEWRGSVTEIAQTQTLTQNTSRALFRWKG